MTALTQKIESAFSRVVNGNFSNHVSCWEPSENLEVFQEEGTQPGEPHLRCKAKGTFRHILQYRDLAVYPSPVCFKGGVLLPMSMAESFVYNLQTLYTNPYYQSIYPFAYRDASTFYGALKPIPLGSWLMVDTGHAETCGEFRLSKIYDNNRALITRVSGREAILAGSPVRAEYSTISPTLIRVRFSEDLSKAKRLDGSLSVKMGDCFAAAGPDCGGLVQAGSGKVWYVNIISPYSKVPPDTGGPNSYRPLNDWKIVEPESVSVTRAAPAALYDLTLAFTLKNGAALSLNSVQINCADEAGVIVGIILPVILSGTNRYLSYAINASYTRYVMRFVLEREIPFYGQFEIYFPQPGTSSESEISDVVLYRGNFTDRFLVKDGSTVEVYDKLEAPIAVESEIIPRGTIIAYAGGAVCPAGFIKVEGIGRNEHNLEEPYILCDEWGSMSSEYVSHEIVYPVSSDEPRTLIKLTGHRSFSIGGQSLPFQVHGKYYSIVPFRNGDPNVVRIRSEIGDPLPIWVNSIYKRVSVVPGYILEFRVPQGSSYVSAYAIITQYSEGQEVIRVWEDVPVAVFFHDEDARKDAGWQVHRGADRNQVYRAYGAYGPFIVDYADFDQIELLGDWDKLVTDAAAKDANLVIWKAGVVAHSQMLPELGAGTLGKGGLSYFGEPHSHDVPEGDAVPTNDVGVGSGGTDMQLPTKHYHGYLFGAVTLPKVRPVLLCQKV